MKQTKICPYCNKAFVTTFNAKKYCRKRCAALAMKKREKKPARHLCQWCGQVFRATRKRKFCNKLCHGSYMRQLGILQKKEYKIPIRITVNDVAKESKKCGISYGKYVSIKRLK